LLCSLSSEDGEWGGHQELYAAAELFGLRVVLHQAEGPRMVISCCSAASSSAFTFAPGGGAEKEAARRGKAPRSIHLSYHGGSHYNSVRLAGDDGWGPAAAIPALEPHTTTKGSTPPGVSDHNKSSPPAYDRWDEVANQDSDEDAVGAETAACEEDVRHEDEVAGSRPINSSPRSEGDRPHLHRPSSPSPSPSAAHPAEAAAGEEGVSSEEDISQGLRSLAIASAPTPEGTAISI
jgi:hypothetical protein